MTSDGSGKATQMDHSLELREIEDDKVKLRQTFVYNAIEWQGNTISLTDYLESESLLFESKYSKENCKVFILMKKDDPEDCLDFKAQCEIYKSFVWLNKEGERRLIEAWNIAGVFVRPEYRSLGYGIQLLAHLNILMEKKHIEMSVLYSSVGERFYQKGNWHAWNRFMHHEIDALAFPPHKNLLEADFINSKLELLGDGSSSLCGRPKDLLSKKIDLVLTELLPNEAYTFSLLGLDDVKTRMPSYVQFVNDRFNEVANSGSHQSVATLFMVPTFDKFDWHNIRTSYDLNIFISNSSSTIDPSTIYLSYGLEINVGGDGPSKGNILILYSLSFRKSRITVLAVSSSGIFDAQQSYFFDVLQIVRQIAYFYGFKTVVMWSPLPPLLSESVDTNKGHLEHSLKERGWCPVEEVSLPCIYYYDRNKGRPYTPEEISSLCWLNPEKLYWV